MSGERVPSLSGVAPSRPAPPLAAFGLAGACVLQAVAGSPTPDAPGAVEAAIALCLLAAFGAGGAVALACGRSHRPADRPELGLLAAVAPVAFTVLVWPPLAVGLAAGWRVGDLLRDLAGIAFLFLPVLALGIAGREPSATIGRWLEAGVATIGVAFALRFLLAVGPEDLRPGVPAWADGMRYLPTDPAVLFAAILLPLRAAEAMARRCLAGTATAAILAITALPCLAVIGLTVQRGAVAAGAAAALVILLGPWAGRGARWALVGLGGMALAVGGPWIATVLTAVIDKTRAVGANGRGTELSIALDAGAAWPGAPLLGRGWGALVDLPSVADGPVSYLHVFAFYLFTKAGLAGLTAGLAVAAGLLRPWAGLLRGDPALALAVAGSVGLAASVHTGFKTMSFGLILCLVVFRLSTR
ncbi:MAG: hypothetical protein RID91_11505 [Azospirillaceae bacterium]